jgi:hypothetical protein
MTLAIATGFMGVLTLFVLFSTGSVIAVFCLWMVCGLIILVLWHYGFIDLSFFNVKSPSSDTKSNTPAPTSTPNAPLIGSEVFHISQNQFTYTDAPAVCAAYGAELATLEQIIDAYNHGAEWCGYGWSAGGFALYPTQKSTWDTLQAEPDQTKRTACGRPGVNGGYFDPNTQFGVNCFGFKPSGTPDLPLPPPGTNPETFSRSVATFKTMLNSFTMDPYSRSTWSGYDGTPIGAAKSYGSQFQQNLNGLGGKESFGNGDPAYSEAPVTNSSYSAGPYGLRGGAGPTGPAGTPGDHGATGPVGLPSTVTGPTGSAGPTAHIPHGTIADPIHVGSRWVIEEEADSRALVFRDLLSPTGDHRYAMMMERGAVDL